MVMQKDKAITPDTRISTILSMDGGAVDVLVGISKHFKRLRNPILRKTLAKRVTIRQAAGIGKVSINEFLDQLARAGYQVEYPTDQSRIAYTPISEEDWRQMGDDQVVTVDARPDIEAGRDPFHRIMEAVKAVPANGFLLVINVFEPWPLVDVMTKKGWRTRLLHEEGVVKTYFQHPENAVAKISEQPEQGAVLSAAKFDQWVAGFGDQLNVIDVRGMEMPLPMVTIQQKLPDLSEGYALFIHHQRIPKFLLPQLDEQGWRYCFKEVGEEVKMLIYQDN